MEMTTSRSIDARFNIILAVILIVDRGLAGILGYKEEAPTLLDKLVEQSALLMTLGGLALITASVLVFMWAIKSFWNRFVAQVFEIRKINYQESLSIALMIAILF